jgi:hypothetical protein
LRAIHGNLDDFAEIFVDPWYATAPPGWATTGKSVGNKEYPNYLGALYRRGWAPAPAARHRAKFYPGYKDEKHHHRGHDPDGAPLELTERERLRDIRKANDQVRNSEIKLSDTPPGTAPRNENPRTRPRVNSHVGPVEIA